MKWIFIAIVIIGMIFIPQIDFDVLSAKPSNLQESYVTRVVDGDTIEVQIDGNKYKVRYIGVDTPETVDPRRPVGYFGKEASAKNKELVEGKAVRLEKDVSDTDRYDRLLRYVYVGEMMINLELIRLGYAKVATYPPDVKYVSIFLDAEREARSTGRGLWAE
jgi:micrococcal nuclease